MNGGLKMEKMERHSKQSAERAVSDLQLKKVSRDLVRINADQVKYICTQQPAHAQNSHVCGRLKRESMLSIPNNTATTEDCPKHRTIASPTIRPAPTFLAFFFHPAHASAAPALPGALLFSVYIPLCALCALIHTFRAMLSTAPLFLTSTPPCAKTGHTQYTNSYLQ
jgi:hypothetical protein